jgi:ribonucleoside-diphosphate reductase alpha chain
MNLSSYVKNKFTKDAYFNYESFEKDVRIAVDGLNEVLDEGIPFHPLHAQKEVAKELRQIGLGIMGYGDMLIMLGLKYGEYDALQITDKIASLLLNSALQESAMLSKKYGAFPRFSEKVLESPFLLNNATEETINLIKQYGLRNSQVLTSAPTGSLSTMWGITGGLEPVYQISYTRKTETLNSGEETYYKVFTPIAREYMEINGIKNESDLPKSFVTAMTLHWKQRIDTQSIWQKYIDASISSTVNLHEDVNVEEVKQLYIYAWQKGLKGITIFRDGCERAGILSSSTQKKQPKQDMSIEELQYLLEQKVVEKLQENPNACPMCGGNLIHSGGCSECQDCGYSPCSL